MRRKSWLNHWHGGLVPQGIAVLPLGICGCVHLTLSDRGLIQRVLSAQLLLKAGESCALR